MTGFLKALNKRDSEMQIDPDAKPIIEGYLMKVRRSSLGPISRRTKIINDLTLQRALQSGINWKERYFVLYPDASLFYFKRKGNKHPKGVMKLDSDFFVGDSTLKKYGFQVKILHSRPC